MTTHNYEKEIEAIQKDLGKLQSDLRSLTQAFARDAKMTARDTVDDVSERAGDLAQRTRKAYRHGIEEVSSEIERHPLASLITAAGLGFVVGSLARR